MTTKWRYVPMKLSDTMVSAIEDLVDRFFSGEIDLDEEEKELTKYLAVTTVQRYLMDDNEFA